jgi:hypothetical protein
MNTKVAKLWKFMDTKYVELETRYQVIMKDMGGFPIFEGGVVMIHKHQACGSSVSPTWIFTT